MYAFFCKGLLLDLVDRVCDVWDVRCFELEDFFLAVFGRLSLVLVVMLMPYSALSTFNNNGENHNVQYIYAFQIYLWKSYSL